VFLFHLPVGFQVLARSQKWLGESHPANLIALLGSVLLTSWILHHAVELPLQNRSARIAYGKRRRSRPAAESPNLQRIVKEVGGARA
jgi:peptidoglycan/LPS O-acetylase OafA/YrhL